MHLNELKDNRGATHSKKRVGRGIGSGLVKTAGRGHKGQRARNTVRLGFEGGQTPIYRRMPKRGFVAPFSSVLYPLNLGKIDYIISKYSITTDTEINFALLKQLKVIKGNYSGVAVLAKGELTKPVNIRVDKISSAAQAKLDELNSVVSLVVSQ